MPTGAPATGARARFGALAAESLWLFAGYIFTAAIGLVFWVVAARATSPAELGRDAALISIISAASTIGSAGVGSALVVMLAGPDRAAVLRRSYRTATLASAAVGFAAGVLSQFAVTTGSRWWLVVPVVMALTVGWSLYSIQAQALLGLGRAPQTVAISAPVNLVKLLAVALVAVLGLAVPHVVLLATMLPAIVAAVVVGLFVLPAAMRRSPAGGVPDESPVTFGQYVRRETVTIGSSLGISLALPFLTTALAGPEDGAVFAIAYQFGAALDLAAFSVAVALARGAVTTVHLRSAGLRVWLRVVGIVAFGAVAVTLGGGFVLGILGPGYRSADGTIALGLLAVACVLRSAYTIWSALMRAARRLIPVLAWDLTMAAVVLGAALLLAPRLGGIGTGIAVVLGAGMASVIGLVGLLRSSRPTPSMVASEGVA